MLTFGVQFLCKGCGDGTTYKCAAHCDAGSQATHRIYTVDRTIECVVNGVAECAGSSGMGLIDMGCGTSPETRCLGIPSIRIDTVVFRTSHMSQLPQQHHEISPPSQEGYTSTFLDLQLSEVFHTSGLQSCTLYATVGA